MIHTPIPADAPGLHVCPACSWRAVVTARAVFITEVGDTSVDHLAMLQRSDITHAARLIARVERLHREGQLSDAQQCRLVAAVLGEFR
jgi:hypothetical protein